MSQGLFAGFTKYSEQSISDIKEDIIRWIDYSERIKKEFQSTMRLGIGTMYHMIIAPFVKRFPHFAIRFLLTSI